MRATTRIIGLASAASGVLLVGLLSGAALAGKPPAPPGQDPCSHGRTGKPCRPDPQPDRGKDCEKHGKRGGVNEDHCAGDTHPPVTVTTAEPGHPVTVTVTPGKVTVSGPGTVIDKGPGTITVKPTKPGVIEVKQPRKVTRIGVPDRSESGRALTG